MVQSSQNNQIDFTKCIIEKGDPSITVEEGEWFTINIKKLFDVSVIKSNGYDLDHLIGFKLDNTEFYTKVRLRLGYFNSLINQIIHKAVYQMKLNEKAQLSFELDPHILDESLTRKSDSTKEIVYLDLNFEICLLSVEKSAIELQKPIYKLNEDELFNICIEHKNDANELYKKNMIRTAFQRYHKSISYLIIAEQLINEKQSKQETNLDESIESNPNTSDNFDNLKKNILDTKSLLYSNLAMCQLKNNNYEMALINCTKCLEIDKSNLKALFRRAQARAGMNDYDEAIADYNLALKLDPNNLEIKQKISQVEHLKKNYNQAISSNLKKLFS